MQILNPGVTSTNQMVKELIAEMNRIIDRDMPLVRSIVSKEEAARIFKEEGYQDKVDILDYRPEDCSYLYMRRV